MRRKPNGGWPPGIALLDELGGIALLDPTGEAPAVALGVLGLVDELVPMALGRGQDLLIAEIDRDAGRMKGVLEELERSAEVALPARDIADEEDIEVAALGGHRACPPSPPSGTPSARSGRPARRARSRRARASRSPGPGARPGPRGRSGRTGRACSPGSSAPPGAQRGPRSWRAAVSCGFPRDDAEPRAAGAAVALFVGPAITDELGEGDDDRIHQGIVAQVGVCIQWRVGRCDDVESDGAVGE